MSLDVVSAIACHGPADGRRASPWVQRWSHLVTPGGAVLDVACGEGRHLAWFLERGHPVVGVDHSEAALAGLGLPSARCETVLADIEGGPWPFEARQFDAVVVTNYLWRPLLSTLAQSLAPGGVLIYETFAIGQETVGKPSRPDYLLQPGELLRAFGELRVIAFEDGFEEGAPPGSAGRFVQRIAAVRTQPSQGGGAERHRLR